MDWIDQPEQRREAYDGAVTYIGHGVKADRKRRHIIAEIEAAETAYEIECILSVYEPEITALQKAFPEYHAAVIEAASEATILVQAAMLANPRTAEPCITTMENDMANNTDFKKIVVKDVSFQWPRLDQPHRFNERDKQSEPCAATAPGAGYSLAFVMDTEAGKALWSQLKAHYNECKSRNAKLPAFAEVFGMKKLDDGRVQFTAKRAAVSRDGKVNKAPTVVGPDLQDLADKAIWSGSRGHIRCLAFPSTNPQDQSGGISLLLDAVQVTEAVYGSDNLEDDFGPAAAPEPSFGDERKAPAPAQDYQGEYADDEIPF